MTTVRSELRRVYIGPSWSSINGYEEFGRTICGTAYLLFGVWLCLLAAALYITIVRQLIRGVTWVARLI